ncbi:MAG: polyamine aminopropyltransferase [Polyangiales bacterium]
MALWYDEIFEDTVRFGLRVKETLYSGRSEYRQIEVLDTVQLGRTLALDNIFMTSEGDEHYYHEMLVHPAMNTAPRRKRALVLGGGDGGTVREILRHPDVERVVMVEIDEQVVEVCKEHLPSIGTAWDDPRLELRFEDALEYVEEADIEPFDVVFLDGTDPVGPGVVLYETGFYEGCKRVLADDGIFALQSESPFLFEETFLEVQSKLRKIFRTVRPYFGPVPIYASGTWSWTWASDACDPLAIDEARAAELEPSLQYYNTRIHRGAFALPSRLERALER